MFLEDIVTLLFSSATYPQIVFWSELAIGFWQSEQLKYSIEDHNKKLHLMQTINRISCKNSGIILNVRMHREYEMLVHL